MQTGKLDKFLWLPCALLAAAAQSTGGGVRRRRVLGHCAQHRRPGPLTRPFRDRFPPPSFLLCLLLLCFSSVAPTRSPPASPPFPAGPAPPLPDSDNTPKRNGKNLGWSQLELLSLVETAPTVLEDAAVGNG